jgi:hypothetical protein
MVGVGGGGRELGDGHVHWMIVKFAFISIVKGKERWRGIGWMGGVHKLAVNNQKIQNDFFKPTLWFVSFCLP